MHVPRKSEIHAGILVRKKKLGLIVNPIAGIGGTVGLKGSDGQDILKKAVELGGAPISPLRAVEALRNIVPIKHFVELITYPHDMGENEAKESGLDPIVIGSMEKRMTTSNDTRNAAKALSALEVDLILFAGGDGTARDICDVIDDRVAVLGIPAGVKIHSAVFAVDSKSAGELATMFLKGKASMVREMEVMDIDEKAFREGRVSAKLFGYMRVPFEKTMIQNPKAGSATEEDSSLKEIAREITENMRDDYIYIIGPGTTTKPIMGKIGLNKTLLGVDVVGRGRLLLSDANESQLLKLMQGKKTKIIVTVVGGQGFIFGRGNQQISSRVIRQVGKENIIIVATQSKLASLKGSPLLVDTGDENLNMELSGYIRVITGYGKAAVYNVK